LILIQYHPFQLIHIRIFELSRIKNNGVSAQNFHLQTTQPLQRKTMYRRKFLRLSVFITSGLITPGIDLGDKFSKIKPDSFPISLFISTNNITLAFYKKGKDFPIIFSHDFPELAFHAP